MHMSMYMHMSHMYMCTCRVHVAGSSASCPRLSATGVRRRAGVRGGLRLGVAVGVCVSDEPCHSGVTDVPAVTGAHIL